MPKETSSVDSFINDLNIYKTNNPSESQTVESFLNLIEFSPKAFFRENIEAHITASAFLVNSDTRQVLLTFHKKLKKWLQLGGHCDGNTDPLDVAFKEVYEESGIEDAALGFTGIFDLDIHVIPETKQTLEHRHFDARYLLFTNCERFIVSSESYELKWFDIDKLEEVTNDISLIKMRDKYHCWSALRQAQGLTALP